MAEQAREVRPGGARPDRRRLASRRPQDVKKQRMTAAVIALLLLIILGILVAGYVLIFVLPPRQLVFRVGDVKYTRGDMVKLLRARQLSVEYIGGRFDYGLDVFKTLDTMIQNEIIAQSAPRFGVTVSDEEVDREVRGILTANIDQAAERDSDRFDREIKERYAALLTSLHITEGEHRDEVRKAILREKFRQFIGESVPNVAEQVHLYRITVEVQDEIDVMQVKLKDALSNSKSPEAIRDSLKPIVREFSRDNPNLVRKGGDLGWVPRGIKEYEDYEYAFFDLEIGELGEPAPDTHEPNLVYFYLISERQTARELDAARRDELKTSALAEWINEERDRHDVFANFNSEIYAWMVDQLDLTTTRPPTPEPSPLDRLPF